MPYEISFAKQVPLLDRQEYINECCVGGDAVVNQLLPSVRSRCIDIQTNQEDWGWFIWFNKGRVKLAIDVFTDDPEQGLFRIHLTSPTKRFFLSDTVVDTPELEELRALIESQLAAWGGQAIRTTQLDRNYMS
ncbi:MAG: hypothetical protein DMG13_33855 [Acidobacteria bacterium]|nr:MAG: hypothetical protein DMG13_33855 [Acidobacteriota bacterium]